MAAYVFGSHLSYSDYLQAQQFVGDINRASRDAGRTVSMKVSRGTREIIASQRTLVREQINVAREQIEAQRETARRQIEAQREAKEALQDGFETLSYGLSNISSGIAELNATFHWGFSEVLAQLGHMNDTLSELVKIAKTPVQTVAFNHFEIARDAFRQCLYREALEELARAVEGDHTSSGYKLEWRFHHLRGVIRLGFVGCDKSLMDLAQAEEAFLAAARYARTDYPQDAGRAFLSAGWAAYCQGKMPEALSHTEQAMKAHPGLGEAPFQAAKVLMAMGRPQNALPFLCMAIERDRFFALKASGDGDFRTHEETLRNFLDALRKGKFRQVAPWATGILKTIRAEYRISEALATFKNRLEEFLMAGKSWPLWDIEQLGIECDEASRRMWCLIKDIPSVQVTVEVTTRETVTEMETETYSEEVLVRPAGLLRKAQYRQETRTRQVPKTKTKTKTKKETNSVCLERHEIGPLGAPLICIEFVRIPAGQFIMGEGEDRHEVRLTRDFSLGRYPVTQKQWTTVMGNNPSHFKGDNHPVERVSWDDAQKFIGKVNAIAGEETFRLPTEAEWEYACRAGSTTAFYFGDDEGLLEDYAWYDKNSGGTTHPVGQKRPNAWGLHDMSGNVCEWCQDSFRMYRSGSVTDPTGPASDSSRMLRGGGWNFGGGIAYFCRSGHRGFNVPGYRSFDVGFRLLRS